MSRWDDFSVCSSFAYRYPLSMALRYGTASPRGVRCRLVAACCPTPLIRACTKGTTLHDAEAAAESGSYMNVSLTFCFYCNQRRNHRIDYRERERESVCVCVWKVRLFIKAGWLARSGRAKGNWDWEERSDIGPSRDALQGRWPPGSPPLAPKADNCRNSSGLRFPLAFPLYPGGHCHLSQQDHSPIARWLSEWNSV